MEEHLTKATAPDYCFWIIFIVSDDCFITIDDNKLLIPLSDGKQLTLRPCSAKTLKGHKDDKNYKGDVELILEGYGFSSRAEAGIFIKKAIIALKLCATRLGFGVEVTWTFAFPSNSFPTRGLSTKTTTGCINENFAAEFYRAYSLDASVTDREKLALDLYLIAHFETSIQARFLIYMAAIESLLERKPKSVREVKYVSDLISMTLKADLPDKEKNGLVNELEWLQCETIVRAGQSFAKNRLRPRKYKDKAAAEFFKLCYDVRGDIIHAGKAGEASSLIVYLDIFVADLLLLGINPEYQTDATDIAMSKS